MAVLGRRPPTKLATLQADVETNAAGKAVFVFE